MKWLRQRVLFVDDFNTFYARATLPPQYVTMIRVPLSSPLFAGCVIPHVRA